MKHKILFILHVPPPITGATIMGQCIKNSTDINVSFKTDYINLTTSFSLERIGKKDLSKLKNLFSIYLTLLKLLYKNDYDLCYMTLTAKGIGFYKDFFIVSILKLFRKKIIYHFHNKGVKKNSEKWYNHLLYRITFYKTQSILLGSNLYQDIERYVQKSNVYFCPNGIPMVQESTSHIKKNVCQLVFLSNMMKEKGILELLKACVLLKKKKIAFECHFIGAWSDISEMAFTRYINEYKITDCIFVHGKKYNEEKLSFYRNADIFVFPTYYHNECFPLVLLEAMQFALPIISTREGAISEMVIDGETGILIEQKNTKELAEKIELLIKNSELRIQMGIAGRQRYEKLFTHTIFEHKMKSILTEAIDNK